MSWRSDGMQVPKN